jgi:hypothetical protein
MVARHMGFKEECMVRWMWVIPECYERNRILLRDEDLESPKPGQHSVMFSLCANDWENRGREYVQCMIDRRQ